VRVSQLAATAGVPVATVKFYLREGLLHDGQLTSATQAKYDESHVSRLNLIRALVGSAGLSVASARQVLKAIDNPPSSKHELLGAAHHAAASPPSEAVDVTRARELLTGLGWDADTCDEATLSALVGALNALDAADFTLSPEMLRVYATSMMEVAKAEIAGVPTDSAEAAARYVVLGTVLVEPLLLALRRLAQQSASAQRFKQHP